jgi:hypothetical protein
MLTILNKGQWVSEHSVIRWPNHAKTGQSVRYLNGRLPFLKDRLISRPEIEWSIQNGGQPFDFLTGNRSA